MYLRDVQLTDVAAYLAMRCDPAMMSHLGGPRPPDGIAAKVASDVADVQADRAWISMIVLDEHPPTVAGTVTLWSHEAADSDAAARISEIGWMVLPAFQGQGLAKRAVHALVLRARDDGRWGVVHAYPSVLNPASNRVCAAIGFDFVGRQTIEFAGRRLATNHWRIDTGRPPAG